ncbi:dienelactone hydrolase family protein [Phenylobacterium deserti]|uniref:Dienelactone hydrolase family protein n=1 Tax=Phenylobacterium deserti TaxID=1914756 RepID=A0A328ADR0_9CAUL|nr:dienelactone hydrolase family protein [Phenylobacterium deserti]RAK52715.1 dienelactone hydrolase family protein [Phenylobacterium deserti]
MPEFITIDGPDGPFRAFVARPEATTPRPVVLVLQEILGVNANMREVAEAFATQGYIGLAPDLFWRFEPGFESEGDDPAEWEKALGFYGAYDIDQGVADVQAAVATARTLPGADGKVAVMGYCLGGLMSFLTAARTEVDAAVAYYGGGTERFVAEAASLRAPFLTHLAEADEYIDAAARAKIQDALSRRPNAEVHTYPGRNHAFARHRGAHFHAADAALADSRTAEFLARHLR